MKHTDKMVIEGVRDFHPDQIFDCGQCFRWEKEADGSYTGIAGGRIINADFRPDEDEPYCGQLILSNTTAREAEEIWRNYFDLDRDYGAIKDALTKKDPVIGEAINYGQGIRLLKQDKWETLISFILSQNNNIPRIKTCIDTLCQAFGERIGEYRGKVRYAFPTPQRLAALTAEDLSCCRLGYRADYLVKTARRAADDGLEQLERMGRPETSFEEALAYVGGFCGVGPKVANCILLFSMNKWESFPLDVWMKKAMQELYGFKENDVTAMSAFAQETFGPYRGIAQQYLFYYRKNRLR